MAFVLGLLIGAPTIAYIGNEVTNTIHDIVQFDYSNYFETKISNGNLKTKIFILEMELKQIENEYVQINNLYKDAILNRGNLIELSQQRAHIIKLRTQCKKHIHQLKSQVIL